MLYCNLYKLYWEVRSLVLNKQYSSFWELLCIQQELNKNPGPRPYSCQVVRLDEDLGWCGCEAHALSTHNHQRMLLTYRCACVHTGGGRRKEGESMMQTVLTKLLLHKVLFRMTTQRPFTAKALLPSSGLQFLERAIFLPLGQGRRQCVLKRTKPARVQSVYPPGRTLVSYRGSYKNSSLE